MYFALTSSANLLMIGTLLAAGQALTAKPVVALGIALLASLANMLAIEPLATRLMFQRCAGAGAAGRGLGAAWGPRHCAGAAPALPRQLSASAPRHRRAARP
jgi:hypothetical protein